uniref:Tetratricopeptide TPR_2 repeat protein n=1 Tax=Solibacter usitatus (strain Ellin6076) TaxID=234267 RepID=Q01XI9_SOLUE
MPSHIKWITVTLLAGTFIAGCSKETRSLRAVEKGQEFLKKKEFAEATLNFRRAVQADSKNPEAYYGLGQSLEASGNLVEAQASLAMASRLKPADDRIQKAYGDATLTMFLASRGEVQAHRDMLEKQALLLLAKNPASSDGLRYQAYIRLTDRKPVEAIALLNKAGESRPWDAEIVLPLVQAHMLNGGQAEAESVADQGIARNKEFFPLYDALILHYTRQSPDLAKAEKYARLKTQNNPGNAASWLSLARFYAETRQPEKCRSVLEKLTGDTTKFPDAWMQAGDLYTSLGALTDAERHYREGAAKAPKQSADYEKKLATVLASQGKRDDAFAIAERLVKQNPKDLSAIKLRAFLFLESGDKIKVRKALEVYQGLAVQQPGNAEIYLEEGRAYIGLEDLKSAKAALEQARKLAPGSPLILGYLVNVYLQMDSFTNALAAADEILISAPADPGAHIARSRALSGLGRGAEARQELSRLAADRPRLLDAEVELAFLDLAQGQAKKAETALRRFYQPGLPSSRTAEGLARAIAAQGQPGKALELLQTELKQTHDRPSVLSALGDMAVAARNWDVAIKAYEDLAQSRGSSAALEGRIAEVYEAKGDIDTALVRVRSARGLEPKNANLIAYTGYLLEKSGRREEAIKEYRECLRTDPNRTDVANNLAFQLAEMGGNGAEALRLAEDCVRRQPRNTAYQDTLGWVYYKSGDFNRAASLLQQVVTADPGLAGSRYRLALAFVAKNDKTRARDELQRALAANATPTQAQEIREALSKLGK